MSVCQFCGAAVKPDDSNTYTRVLGWEKRAHGSSSRRGGSDIVLRERLETFACMFCIDALKHGRAPSQGSLI